MWWPLDVPDPRRPLGAAAHLHFTVHSALAFLLGELIARRMPTPSTGRALLFERGFSVAAGIATWALFTGAWDRRANGRS